MVQWIVENFGTIGHIADGKGNLPIHFAAAGGRLPTHSLSSLPSLSPSLSHSSLPLSLPPSLTPPFPSLLSPSLPLSLPSSLSQSLTRSLAYSILTHSFDRLFISLQDQKALSSTLSSSTVKNTLRKGTNLKLPQSTMLLKMVSFLNPLCHFKFWGKFVL